MQTQVVFQAGNSFAVVIPKHLMKDLKFKKGQKVTVDKSPDGEAIVIKKAFKTAVGARKSVMNEEFKKWLNTALAEDAEILDELALR